MEDIALLKQYDLAHRWIRQPQDRWQKTEEFLPGQTPDILLLERCLALLRPGGRMAVVLPDGLLHNSSSGYVRFWLRERADVVAVLSIPQEAFVPYGTGIKTSLVFLRKRPAPALASCFMARIRNIGYDVKGQTVYRHDKSGQILRDRSGLPLIEDDIERITQAYRASAAGNLTPQGDDIFAVPSEALNSRLDVEHYLPGDRELLDRLNRAGAKRLGDIARIVTESADFRLRGEEEIRYIAISDVDARTMQVVSQQALRAHEAPSRATYRVQKGDIITAVSGASTGTSKHVTAMITDDEAGAICSNGLAVLRDIEQVDALFLLCYLRTEPFLRQVRRLMTGHAIPAISLEDLANVLVPVPPQALQREIVQTIRHIQTLRREAQTTGEQLITRLQDALSHFCNAVPQEFVCTEINSFATGALRQVSAAEGYKKRGSCPCI